MGDAKYVVHDGRRWRELDLRSGCVWGWGAVNFAYARRGQLVPVSRARVLRALRARAAGDPGLCAVKDGPPLPEIRNLRPGRKSNDRRTPKRKRTARRMTDPPLHTTHQYNSQEVLSTPTHSSTQSGPVYARDTHKYGPVECPVCCFRFPNRARLGVHVSNSHRRRYDCKHCPFVTTQSVAIIKYLSRENLIPDSLFPKENKLRARVDEFLEWQHIGLRLHCAMYFRVKVLDPVFTRKAPEAKTLLGYEKRMISSLEAFEKHWLQNGTEFIAGDTISVADLLAACELEQPRAAGYDPAENFEGISCWWKKVRKHFNPYYDEAHVVINKVAAKNKLAAKL